MSHLSKVKIALKNKQAVEYAAKVLGWSMSTGTFTNKYDRAQVPNATILKDTRGTVKYVIGADGTPVVDEWDMKKDYYKFNQEYTQYCLKQKAMTSGAAFRSCGVDKSGNLVVEIQMR